MSKETGKSDSPPPSKILLAEYYAAEDPRFATELKRFTSPKLLSIYVEKWLANRSPWAREQIIVYLEGELNLPGHELVFKRIFKHFEKSRDHEMMGVFMVVLDRMVRRTRIKRYHYNWQARQSWVTEHLRARPNQSTFDIKDRYVKTTWGKWRLPDILNKPTNILFSNRTRNYLRRAAWRYFRQLSYREPETYIREIVKALSRYQDQDFYVGENIIDNWSFMHACYFNDPNIVFTGAHANIVPNGSLAELKPHPYQLEAWKTDSASEWIVNLILDANSTMVRIWAIDLYQQEHGESLGRVDWSTLTSLMRSEDSHVQKFAVEVFDSHPKLPSLIVAEWLALIENSSPNLLPTICDAMRKHVNEERLGNEQLIKLACAQPTPVAEMGLEYLQQRDRKKPLRLEELVSLADAECYSVASSMTEWALRRICELKYDVDHVVDFFDAMIRPMRNAAMTWLGHLESPGFHDPALWARLIESPFDDVKLELVHLLNCRENSIQKDTMTPVWVSVILGVHRGGRTKPKAISQLSDELARKPERANELLPVLAVALRSLRAPEMRSALVSLVRLANHSDELRAKIDSLFPELELAPAETNA